MEPLGDEDNCSLGEEIGESLFSGIMKFFKSKSFIGKQFPFVVNLEPKR